MIPNQNRGANDWSHIELRIDLRVWIDIRGAMRNWASAGRDHRAHIAICNLWQGPCGDISRLFDRGTAALPLRRGPSPSPGRPAGPSWIKCSSEITASCRRPQNMPASATGMAAGMATGMGMGRVPRCQRLPRGLAAGSAAAHVKWAQSPARRGATTFPTGFAAPSCARGARRAEQPRAAKGKGAAKALPSYRGACRSRVRVQGKWGGGACATLAQNATRRRRVTPCPRGPRGHRTGHQCEKRILTPDGVQMSQLH